MNKTIAILKNMSTTVLYQAFAIIIGFFIIKLELTTYGASIHGMVSTSTNIINYLMLLYAGLTTAATQSLYKPFSEANTKKLNSVFNAIKNYYFKTGVVLFIAVLVTSTILPFIIGNEIKNFTVFFLMFGVGMQQVLDCFLISKSRALLQADQKLYVINYINTISFLFRGVIQILLIINKADIIIVIAVPACLVLFQYIFLERYIKQKYPILDPTIKADYSALSKRRSAFVHQISGLILNSTDVIILSIFSNQVIVSIYAVYQLVFSNIYGLVMNVFSTGFVASFGQLFAVDDLKAIQRKYSQFELLYFLVISIIYSACAVMILPFIELFTAGVPDVKYVDVNLGILFIASGLLNNLRVPALTIIDAVGYYKETQGRAIIEMLINLILSLSLVQFLGIYGVLLGTIISFLYRTTDMIIFSNTRIVKKSNKKSFMRVIKVFVIVLLNFTIFTYFVHFQITDWFNWFIYAIIVTIVSTILSAVLNYLSERQEFYELINMILNIVKKRIYQT